MKEQYTLPKIRVMASNIRIRAKLPVRIPITAGVNCNSKAYCAMLSEGNIFINVPRAAIKKTVANIIKNLLV